MPNALLSVPHFEQSRDGYCLPACVQMVLAYLGKEKSEAELISLLRTASFGTPISAVSHLRELGLRVTLGSFNESWLEAQLLEGNPIIARVWTTMLTTWTIDTSHVVVVVGFDETFVYLNDPAFTSAPQVVTWNSFLAAWAEFDETSILIS